MLHSRYNYYNVFNMSIQVKRIEFFSIFMTGILVEEKNDSGVDDSR